MNNIIDTIVFDVGNVLLDWDPRHLYRQLIADEREVETFLSEICTPDWNVQQDCGRSWKTATAELTEKYPGKAHLINAFDERWEETITGPIAGSVDILRALHSANVPLYSITNFSAEKFPLVQKRYDFFDCFRDIVISGEEKTIKPHREIFQIFFERSGCQPEQCLFIDDSAANIDGAKASGMEGHHFRTPEALASDLRQRGFSLG